MTVTDTRTVTVALSPPPDVKIAALVAPTTAKPGDTVGVLWRARNDGGDTTYDQWIVFTDTFDGKRLFERHFVLSPGAGTAPETVNLIMPNRALTIKVEAGYGTTPTAMRQITIGIRAVVPLGLLLVLAPFAVGAVGIAGSRLLK